MENNPQKQAEDLFLNTNKTQKEIALQLGIDPKTLYRWIKQGQWQQLKSATRRMPSILVENIYEQLDDINYSISQRDRGNRHPTKDESLTINRLINCIGKVKLQTSQAQNIEFLMNFINWMQTKNNDLAKDLTEYGSAYLNGTKVQGFHPYDIEYDTQDSPLEGGQGDVEVQTTSSAQEHDTQLELPFPEQPILNHTSLSFGEGRGEVSTSIGHESGIQNPPENPTQSPENQRQAPQTPTPQMPENNFPEDRASLDEEAPPLFLGEVPEGGRGQLAPERIPPSTAGSPAFSAGGDVPETTNVVSEQGCVATPDQDSRLNETAQDPNEEQPDFSDPELLIKMYKREKGIPLPEDTQLFSIGEKIFTMRVDNKKKKR